MADEPASRLTTSLPDEGGADTRRKPMMCRVPADMIPRIERAAKRHGLSCSAFMVMSTAKELERMEG